MSRLVSRAKTVMTGHGTGGALPLCLNGLSRIYESVVRGRASLYGSGVIRSHRLPCKVISVGNIVAGGTGKTPMTLFLARLLIRSGQRVAILSRGYRGQAEKTGGIVCDGKTLLMGPDEAGDEPFMMASHLKSVPVLVGRNRCESGRRAVEMFRPDVILLDDAFQHLKLKRDLNLVLLDSRSPFGNGHLLPLGLLREPLSALERADAFVLTRWNSEPPPSELPSGKPVFRTGHTPYLFRMIPAGRSGQEISVSPNAVPEEPVPPSPRCNADREVSSHPKAACLTGRNAFAFSGIARNEAFVESAMFLGCKICGAMGFPDHHPWSGADFRQIFQAARAAGAEMLVTTEKDYARLSDDVRFPLDLGVIGIEISMKSGRADFEAFLKKSLSL
ncbi:tetraacyldisaccharide 4'-kinase [Desulfonema ishimotonii]|uniref:Tetraacyldisaccharide 4'-kinase n=1 Tax=Desulfonema ishimotonii TaxID=45657 RepID=A0A401G3M9_9BACT|nr:tetraacyldisaccharide 4'-kinase [Desulfonema ishimotonii]GBC63824.1 tetraacyldisaccharide 4'-kinase [Desulfonema ishimotonii]